jgi:SNF2 family DNA or RNA helicase
MIAYATNRQKAFDMDVDVYITNHDAVKWVVKNLKKGYFDDFDTLIIDEVTAFKNPNSKRSKAMLKISKYFAYREAMTGTPNPNSITEVWHPTKIVDDGLALGTGWWKFRSIVCEPKQVGPSINHIKWLDKDGASHSVYDMIDHMVIRHNFEDCVDIPPNKITEFTCQLPPGLRAQYDDMKEMAMALLNDGKIVTAVHASAVHTKLLQIAAGAVYTSPDEWSSLDNTRTELVFDLIEERESCLVAFNWRHQRELLVAEAKKRGISYAIIDGSVHSDAKRLEAIEGFQSGEFTILLAHPQSAGHGLTLTKGTTTIWTSPTYNSEHYKQFNYRIYRAGQTRKTETIHIKAEDTIEEKAYARLDEKLSAMQVLLDLI